MTRSTPDRWSKAASLRTPALAAWSEAAERSTDSPLRYRPRTRSKACVIPLGRRKSTTSGGRNKSDELGGWLVSQIRHAIAATLIRSEPRGFVNTARSSKRNTALRHRLKQSNVAKNDDEHDKG